MGSRPPRPLQGTEGDPHRRRPPQGRHRQGPQAGAARPRPTLTRREQPVPVLWLCGPPGVGKTTVGCTLYRQLGSAEVAAAYVDIDQLGICLPEQPSDPGRLAGSTVTWLHLAAEPQELRSRILGRGIARAGALAGSGSGVRLDTTGLSAAAVTDRAAVVVGLDE